MRINLTDDPDPKSIPWADMQDEMKCWPLTMRVAFAGERFKARKERRASHPRVEIAFLLQQKWLVQLQPFFVSSAESGEIELCDYVRKAAKPAARRYATGEGLPIYSNCAATVALDYCGAVDVIKAAGIRHFSFFRMAREGDLPPHDAERRGGHRLWLKERLDEVVEHVKSVAAHYGPVSRKRVYSPEAERAKRARRKAREAQARLAGQQMEDTA